MDIETQIKTEKFKKNVEIHNAKIHELADELKNGRINFEMFDHLVKEETMKFVWILDVGVKLK